MLEGEQLRRVRRAVQRGEGDEGFLMGALREGAADGARLLALRGLRARSLSRPDLRQLILDEARALVTPSREALVDPFLRGFADVVLAEAGEGAPAELVGRARGRRGRGAVQRSWPARMAVAKRRGEGWEVRRLAVQALGALAAVRNDARDPALEALPPLLDGDPDWAVRREAALALVAAGGGLPLRADVQDLLRRSARDDPRRAVRVAAAQGVGQPVTRLLPGEDPDELYAWRVPPSEPYYRYLAGAARAEYSDELARSTRDGRGRNWWTFGVLVDEDLGEEPPDDVPPESALVRALRDLDAPRTQARDLAHHPAIAWDEGPSWPICCSDFAQFHGHSLESAAPEGQDPERWFLDWLAPNWPAPGQPLSEMEAETYVFRCGWCGVWLTEFAQPL